MINYYKYLPVSAEDENWGLVVLNAGCTHIEPGTPYPYQEHPSHHYFNWANGRVLHEYQIIYITKGEGIFESERAGEHLIEAGSVILLYPEERHRYKPKEETGWDEYWIGFRSSIFTNQLEKGFFDPKFPVIKAGFQENLLNLFQEIIAITKEEKAGYQSLTSGAALHIIGHLYTILKQSQFAGQAVDQLVNKARCIFRSNIEKNISPQEVADELQVGYSWFRKAFKAYTGLAPGQYLIQLKIQKAKELLQNPTKSIKEITYELNFESRFYFSKIFKEKTGLTPVQYRSHIAGEENGNFNRQNKTYKAIFRA
ncbi:AraC family transcriptional regulator [Adhaeribacter arboris]|uniref:AraC family transcriptional regulator n=1 Tax=Adhaeribacter arboris TaxID=2072846 RepID=A0A2T2YIL3_9BACT|nr:AraC family transcriptional regulator [Adhaeribacter arboris]PSR55341.1 AraC family transcriptional regulator [Adhaeribacter arboris]